VMKDRLPDGAIVNVSGIGKYQLHMNTMSMLMGGHARTGLEDNVFYRKNEPAVSNAQMVERLVRIAGELGREIATPEEARQILGMKGK